MKIAFTMEELMQWWEVSYLGLADFLGERLSCNRAWLYRENAGKFVAFSPDEIIATVRVVDHWGRPRPLVPPLRHFLTGGIAPLSVLRRVNIQDNYTFFAPLAKIWLLASWVYNLEMDETDKVDIYRHGYMEAPNGSLGSACYKSPIKLHSRSELLSLFTRELYNATMAALATAPNQLPQDTTNETPASEPLKKERKPHPKTVHAEMCRVEAKRRWDGGSALNLTAMALEIKAWLHEQTGESYDADKTYQDWIRQFNPHYKPGSRRPQIRG